MAAARKKKQGREWHQVSVSTLRAYVLTVVLIVAGVAGFFGYKHLQKKILERDAREAVAEANLLIENLRGETDLGLFRAEFEGARENLEEAERHLAANAFAPAFDRGDRSRTILQSIDAALHNRTTAGEAQFVALDGKIEYRRGTGGEWKTARNRLVLQAGDYVKTSANGSAEIMFFDGTLFNVRPNSVILVKRTERAAGKRSGETISLQYGWVNMNTSLSDSTVATPSAQATIDSDSSASVVYNQESNVASFSAYEGGLEVAAADGKSRRLGAMETVSSDDSGLTATKALLMAPDLLEPDNSLGLELPDEDRVVLRWQQVPGARSYWLQVSRSRLFVDNVIDVEDRVKTSATLGVLGEGSFVWRVAARDPAGVQGPWSSIRKFRVTQAGGADGEADGQP